MLYSAWLGKSRDKEKRKNTTLSEKKKEVSILKIEKGRLDEE